MSEIQKGNYPQIVNQSDRTLSSRGSHLKRNKLRSATKLCNGGSLQEKWRTNVQAYQDEYLVKGSTFLQEFRNKPWIQSTKGPVGICPRLFLYSQKGRVLLLSIKNKQA